jgi:hypothetical protein
MIKVPLFSGIALATAVLGLGVASPVFATGLEQRAIESTELSAEHSALQVSSPELIAARHCFNKRVYHPAYYTRGVLGRRVYHKAYYTTQRVCS